ncbi:MAG: hypothetical protein JXQ83_11675 [Candidatus Glassbacteria bacterium]|nr:hypothetical protein [Candidatus Glassbacteria bacterium]
MKIFLQFLSLLITGTLLLNCSGEELAKSSSGNIPGIEAPLRLAPAGTGFTRLDSGVYLLAGNTPGFLEAPAWWRGDRPGSGQVVVLEVEYRDSIAVPARAEVFSGMGPGESYSELHRLGGTGDNAWKLARIPCPAELTMLHLPDSTIRFRLVSESSGLYLRDFRLARPQPGDEACYNAETREWVRRVQAAAARVAPEYYALAESPQLPAEWAEKALVPFHREWMGLVMTISAPQAGETEFPVRVRMAQNEYEPVQLGVYANGSALEEVAVEAGPVLGPGGSEVAKADVRVAEYSLIDSRISALEVEPFPLRLWPNYRFDVPEGRSHLVRIELHTADSTAVPGKYSVPVKIKAKGVDEIEVQVSLEILPVRLLTVDEAGLKLGGHIRGLVPEYDLAFQRTYNHNLAGVYVLPGLKHEPEASFSMDFRVLDDWMASAARQGFHDIYLFLGGNPFGFPQTMTLERQLAEAALGLDNEAWRSLAMEKPDSVHPKIAPLYREWARRLGEHAKSENWPRLVLTPFDEPNKWSDERPGIGSLAFIKPHFIHSAELLRRGFPEAPVAADMFTYDNAIVFLPYLDIYSTNSTHLHPGLPAEIKQAGKEFWEYSTVDLTASFNRYTLGYFFGAHGSRGAHLWAYNWGKRFDTLGDPNWQYAWYTPFGVVPTPCLEGVREGMDDRRLIETLKQAAAAKNVDVSAFLESLFAEALLRQDELRMFVISTWRHAQSGKTFTIEDFRRYEKAAAVMNRWHDRLLDKLVELQDA